MKAAGRASLFVLLCFLFGAGCGNVNVCFFSNLSVSPANATIPSGTSQTFVSFGTGPVTGCLGNQGNLVNVVWTASESFNATLTTSQGRATVTCISPGVVTITSTLPADANQGHTASGTATLTCQ